MSFPPFEVRRIDHVVLRVADLERAIAFYGDVLGCRVERRRDDLGLVHLRAGASQIDLVAIDGPLGRPGGGPAAEGGRNVDHFALRVDPFDEAAIGLWLQGQGLPAPAAAERRFGAEGEGPSIYLRDPDGNTIELKGPAQPA